MAKEQLDSFQTTILTCTNCNSKVTPTFYCQTCEEFLCQDCKELHNNWKKNADHVVNNIDDATSEIVASRQKFKSQSEKHNSRCMQKLQEEQLLRMLCKRMPRGGACHG